MNAFVGEQGVEHVDHGITTTDFTPHIESKLLKTDHGLCCKKDRLLRIFDIQGAAWGCKRWMEMDVAVEGKELHHED